MECPQSGIYTSAIKNEATLPLSSIVVSIVHCYVKKGGAEEGI